MRTLKTKTSKLIYACAALGVNLLNLMVGSYLCSAIIAEGFGAQQLANHTFEGHDLVIAGLWAIFGVIAKIIDGVIDIPMASFTDRLKSRWGRRRPAILIGMVPMIISYCLFLLVPNKEGITLLNTIYYFVILSIFYTTYTLTMVTYYATFTEIVDTEEDRRFISNVKSVCDIVYFILGFVLVPMFLNGLNIRIVALIVLPLVLTMLIPIFMIKEPSTKDGANSYEKTVNLFQSLKYTFKNKDFIVWMVVYAFMTFGLQLFLNGINEFFSITGLSMMIVMASSFAPVPFTFFIYNRLIKKKGFGFAFRYVLSMYSIGMIGMFFAAFVQNGTIKLILAIVCALFCSLAVGALFSVAYSIPSQLAAEDEQRTGISHSAMYFAVQGLFSGVASGIGGTAFLTLLKKSSFNGQKGTFYTTLFAGIACLIACLLIAILPASIRRMGKENAEGEVYDDRSFKQKVFDWIAGEPTKLERILYWVGLCVVLCVCAILIVIVAAKL